MINNKEKRWMGAKVLKRLFLIAFIVSMGSLVSSQMVWAQISRSVQVNLKDGILYQGSKRPSSKKEQLISPQDWWAFCPQHGFKKKIRPGDVADAGRCPFCKRQLVPYFVLWYCPQDAEENKFAMTQGECSDGTTMVEAGQMSFPYICTKCATMFAEMPPQGICPLDKKGKVILVQDAEDVLDD